MKRRMRQIVGSDGRMLMVAMDHTAFLREPIDGLVNYGKTISASVAAGADAFLAPIGSAQRYDEEYGAASVVVSVDTAAPFDVHAVSRALAIGADGVKAMVYPFGDDDGVNRSAALAAQASAVGLPYLAEPVPGGFSRTDMRSPEIIASGARVAAETGADMIKTFYTGDPKSMRRVVDYAGVPVIILGGHAKDSLEEFYSPIWDAINHAGVVGVAVGTNIWMSKNPGGVVRGLNAILHENATVEQAVSAAK